MATINVTASGPDLYRVSVEDSEGRTMHEVTATDTDISRYAPGVSAERLLEASFRFLLQREPKESILTRFELTVIERYFPEYPTAIREELRT